MENFLKFRIGKYEFFVPLKNVVRVLPAAALKEYPVSEGSLLLGYIILEGEPVAVFDIYQRVGLTFPGMDISHKMILMKRNGFRFLLVVDEVADVLELDPAQFNNFAMNTYTSGSVLIDSSGRFIINDLGTFIKEDVLLDLTTGEKILAGDTHEQS
ncbi:MAG: chemotaxis protein CheW [Ignavibacteria bacterium]|nr:chemotaxis protein CheW [Ignavibacteria bacterium]